MNRMILRSLVVTLLGCTSPSAPKPDSGCDDDSCDTDVDTTNDDGDDEASGDADAGDADEPPPNAGALVEARVAHPAARGMTLMLTADTELVRLVLPDGTRAAPGEPFLATVSVLEGASALLPLWIDLGGEALLLEEVGSSLVGGAWPLNALEPLFVALTASDADATVVASGRVFSHPRAAIVAGITHALHLFAETAEASDDARLPLLLGEVEAALTAPFLPSLRVGLGGVAALACAGDVDAATPPLATTAAGDVLPLLAATREAVWVDLGSEAPGSVEITAARSVAGEAVLCSASVDIVSYTVEVPEAASTAPSISVTSVGAESSFAITNAPGSCLVLGEDEGVRVEPEGGAPTTVTASVPPGSSEVCTAEVTVRATPEDATWASGLTPHRPNVTFASTPPAFEDCPGVPATTGLGFRDLALDGRPSPEVLVSRQRDYAVYAIPTSCVAQIDPAAVKRSENGILILEESYGPSGDESPTYIEELVVATNQDQCVVVNASIVYSDHILVVATGELQAAMDQLSRLIGTFTAISSWAREYQEDLPADFEPSAFKLMALLFELALKGYDAIAGDPDLAAALDSFERAMPGSTARLRELVDEEGESPGLLEDGALALSAMGLFNHTFVECGSYVYCVGCSLAGESHHIVHRPEVDHYARTRWYHDLQSGELVDEGAYYEGVIPP